MLGIKFKKNLLRYVDSCNTQAVNALLELLDGDEISELDREISGKLSYPITCIKKDGVYKYCRPYDDYDEYIDEKIIITKEEFYEFFKFLVTKTEFKCHDKYCLKCVCELYEIEYDDSKSAYQLFRDD